MALFSLSTVWPRPPARRSAAGWRMPIPGAGSFSCNCCRGSPCWPRWPGRSAPRRRPRTPAPGRLARHRRDGRRPRRAADRAGGRWPPRLVRVRLHPHLRRPRRARPAALRTAPTVGRAAVHQPAPAGQLQLRRVQPGDGGVRRGDLSAWCSWCPTTCPSCGFQRPADRRQPDPLRPRATAPGAAAAAPDALAEPQAAGGRRLRDHGPGLLDGRAPERRRDAT